jgi:putative FmdB family regulatory protein
MPIYEYRCDQCGQQFEIIQKFSDNPMEICETCQGHLTKLISQTSFQLKGTGWYITDYARKSKSSETKSNQTEAKSAPAAPASSETSAPAKPAAAAKD